MKKFYLVFAFLLFLIINNWNLFSCSEIFINNTSKISARNFDFMFSDGLIRISPRGQQRESDYTNAGDKKMSWISKFGSVSFLLKLPRLNAEIDSELILAGIDGINEKGFKVGTYYLADAEFNDSENVTTLSISILMQYLLDNFDSVDSAILDITSGKYNVIEVPTELFPIRLHYYLHDINGNSAIVEFLKGETIIYKNPEIEVLTNTPYNEALTALKEYDGFGGTNSIPGTQGSIERFVRGAYYAKHLPELKSNNYVNFGFAAIQTVSVSPQFDHISTQWTIVTDLMNKMIYFRTLDNPSISYIFLEEIDFDKLQSEMFLNFTELKLDGNVLNKFDYVPQKE
ncbi:MAG: linear amide C-N hydrolase [Candidatus Cloacimonetes bacterium]|nr:linear amide C-N hydrolase [Candidatus Cloacimonadota bacterium]MCF7815146.1 linear amide C-N hydrolase [Candidatus Cloacimonadota bacterium]MCF7869226.1 linear amide C-N hydrolase [Candidatus Cloacimonadota bacterium]MCF7884765.1 linear amide C-N hydrolase [Candidatus Cloacimonadota bacterium]